MAGGDDALADLDRVERERTQPVVLRMSQMPTRAQVEELYAVLDLGPAGQRPVVLCTPEGDADLGLTGWSEEDLRRALEVRRAERRQAAEIDEADARWETKWGWP